LELKRAMFSTGSPEDSFRKVITWALTIPGIKNEKNSTGIINLKDFMSNVYLEYPAKIIPSEI
jgi:hypothetical protein